MTDLADGQRSSRPPEVLSAAQRAARVENNDNKGSLILRIKRKRGADPISALRIESLLSNGIDPSQVEDHAKQLQDGVSGSPEDRAESLSVSKRRATERGIFRLADTVSASTFANEASTRKLEQRITELKKVTTSAHVKSLDIKQSLPVKNDTVSKEPAKDSLKETLRFKIVKATANKDKQGSIKSKSSSSSLRSRAVQSKYNRSAGKGSISLMRKNLDASASPRKSAFTSRLRFIDAVMERSKSGVKSKAVEEDVLPGKENEIVKAKSSDTEMDLLDKRFADLLGNYLKENDFQPPKDLYDSSVVTDSLRRQDDKSEDDSEEEYVYDIYVREKETMWGSGIAGASDAGLLPAKVDGHEDIGSTYNVPAEAQYNVEPMATLVGFSDEDDLITEMENASILMGQEIPGDSDDEFDEGEDEDSNDEGFYRNDYPEDEGIDEDEMNQGGWGWSGPRRRGQRQSSDDEDDENGSDESGSDLHN